MEESNDDNNHYNLEKIVLYSYILFISLLMIVTLFMIYKYIIKNYFKENISQNIHQSDIIPEKERIYINKLLEQFINK
tara:strand:+ start:204 stop:437 length:234 start_codon:yes stop_codon:yes gene_type:complete